MPLQRILCLALRNCINLHKNAKCPQGIRTVIYLYVARKKELWTSNQCILNLTTQMLRKDKARGAILGYYVLHRVNSTPPWVNKTVDGAETTSLLVGPLNEHTTYEFSIRAFNGKGVSNLSALVEKTTHQHSECYLSVTFFFFS